jgi:hypothetical protein
VGRTGTTRRGVLTTAGAAAAGTLAGCSGDSGGGGSGAREIREREEADAALRKRLAASSGALRDQYDAVIAAHPALAGRLGALRASVAEHVRALGGTVRVTRPVEVPAEPGPALRELARAERHVADGHTEALGSAGPELARLLASVAAAGAAHVYLLTAPGGGTR